MSWAIDTNVLLRIVNIGDVTQPVAESALIALRQNGESLSIFSQNLVEFWAVATRPLENNGFGLNVTEAESHLGQLKSIFTLLEDSPQIFSEWERIVRQYQVTAKQTHDARLVAAMAVYNVTHLLTFNTTDFKRYGEITAVAPSAVLEG